MAGPLKRVCLLGAESTGKTTLARALAEAYGRCGTPSSVGRTRRSAAIPRRRGRATSSRTSPGSSAGTRTRSSVRRARCCSATRTRSRRRCSTTSTSASRRTPSTTCSSGSTTCIWSAGSRSPGGTTGSGSSRSSGCGCTSGIWSELAASGSPWASGRGARTMHGWTRLRCRGRTARRLNGEQWSSATPLAATASAWNSR